MRNRSTTTRLALAGVGLTLLLASCGSADNGSSDGAADTTAPRRDGPTAVAPDANGGRKAGDGELVIGVLLPDSGDLSLLKGAQMAERDINAGGGVNGKPVRLVVKSDGGGADGAAAAGTEALLAAKVDAVVGPSTSAATTAVVGTVTGGGTPECSPSATAADLSKTDDNGLFFRTALPDDLQAEALARLVSDDGNQNLAIIAPATDDAAAFVNSLAPHLEDNGAKVVSDVSHAPDGSDIEAKVTEAVSAGPDAIVLVESVASGGKVLAALIQQGGGPADTPIYVTDSLASADLYKAVDATDATVTEGIRGTRPAADAPETKRFAAALAEFAPEVTATVPAARSYDCVVAIAIAAQKASSDAPFGIAANLIEITGGGSGGGTKCDTFAACASALKGDKPVDYVGASGALDLDEWGEPAWGRFELFTFGVDGTIAVDETVEAGG